MSPHSSAHVIGSQVRADVHHRHDQSTFDEIDEDIYNENKVGKKKEGRDTFETEESETAASSSSEAIEEYYVADNIKLKKPPPGSKIEALRDTIEQRVGMERMRIIINLKSSTYKSALSSTKFVVFPVFVDLLPFIPCLAPFILILFARVNYRAREATWPTEESLASSASCQIFLQ